MRTGRRIALLLAAALIPLVAFGDEEDELNTLRSRIAETRE